MSSQRARGLQSSPRRVKQAVDEVALRVKAMERSSTTANQDLRTELAALRRENASLRQRIEALESAIAALPEETSE